MAAGWLDGTSEPPAAPGAYDSILDQVEVTVAAAPPPPAGGRLGRDGVSLPLRNSAGDRVNPSPSPGCAAMATGGPAVHLLPGAGDEPLRLGPLIRPPIELHWTRMIAEINGVAQAEPALHRHLSGSGRVIPPKVLRDGIAALQDNWCFYCRGALGTAPEADHFVPRVRCGCPGLLTGTS